MLEWDFKDPNEILDYRILWSARLEGDEIVTSEWIVPPGITKDNDAFTTDTTTVWLSSGTHGLAYTLINRVGTAGGRTLDQSVKLKVRER